jgi:hypothetical protein
VKSPDQTGDFTSYGIFSTATDCLRICPLNHATKHKPALMPHLFDKTMKQEALCPKSRPK